MSSATQVPMAVLAESLAESINSRQVRVALFTTFNFDPGFFELEVLPLLFDQSFSQVDKVRLLQLEDALRSVDALSVYYDRSALAQDAEPARLDYRRIDVRRATGTFHPKLILLLVDEPEEASNEDDDTKVHQSLIVVAQSANLTRAGWWENVECTHIEEIKDVDLGGGRCSFRKDLLAMLRRISACADPTDEDALKAVRQFLLMRTSTGRFARARSGGRFHTRLFGGMGEKNLASWLGELLSGRDKWNLEIISPYFDPGGAGPLPALIDAINTHEARIYLPKEPDGTALVTQKTYDAVSRYARWSVLPGDVLERGRGTGGEHLMPRRVHAKVYRVWQRDGPDIVLTGSVNLTGSGHSHGAAGNLEAAFLCDTDNEGGSRRWWLRPIDRDAERFVDNTPDEGDGLDPAPVDVSFRFDWGTGQFSYRVAEWVNGPLQIHDIGGIALFCIDAPVSGKWTRCPKSYAAIIREHLRSSSFVVVHRDESAWRLLVHEENMAHRPSLLVDLTADEILEYWSLLTPEQRATFIELRIGLEGGLEGIPVGARSKLKSHDTLFDRFAALYHAFGCLHRKIETTLDEGRFRDAEARLFGAKYDSLPKLLDETLTNGDTDPILTYVTFLSAAQLFDRVRRQHKEFYRECKGRTGSLEALLAKLPEVRRCLPLDEMTDGPAFIEWYEPTFLKDLGIPGRVKGAP